MDYNTFVESVDEILPGVWLGNEATSQSKDFMIRNNIKLVVNASKNIPSKFLGSIHYIRVPVDDPGIPGILTTRQNEDVKIMRECLPIVLSAIHKFQKKRKNILIHCHAGAQRSAIIMAAYLLYSGICDEINDSINHVVKKRNIAFFSGKSVNFIGVFDN
jgi:protein-tyrosine phosphatase